MTHGKQTGIRIINTGADQSFNAQNDGRKRDIYIIEKKEKLFPDDKDSKWQELVGLKFHRKIDAQKYIDENREKILANPAN